MDDFKVRSRHGLIPAKRWEDHGTSINGIREWRAGQLLLQRPNELADFFASHGLCFDCQSHGVVMVGMTKPTAEEIATWGEVPKDEELPIFEVCPTCHGSGVADR